MSAHATTRPFDAIESVSVDIPFDKPAGRPGPRPLIPEVLYPKLYVWYVFISTMDLILTWIILHIGGSEENLLANWVIARFDLPGVVVFKYGLVLMVISICEIIGRNSYRRGKHLGEWAVGLTFIPVVVAVYQLFHAV